ncbi:EamA family transporter [Microbacterium esteraromaticum]|uniref:EamA family transporter n=1 Tax=Microbacterium esteraromaticum TaxID=57043 RepID=UPI003C2F887E
MPLLRTLLLTALAPITWGTTYLVTTELLPPGHPLFAALIRALPAGVIAVVVGRSIPQGTWWMKAALLGTLNIGGFFPLLFIAAERLPGGVAAAVAGAQPLILLALGSVVLCERVRPVAAIAAVAGAAGVAAIVLGPSAALDPLGIAAAVGGVTCTAVGIILTKHWGRPPRTGAVAYAGWQLTAGGLFLLPLTLVFEGIPAEIHPDDVLGYLWLTTAGGLIAYALWFRGIERLPVAAPGLLALLSPVVATILGVALAHEAFTPVQLTGLLVVLSALVAGQLAVLRQPRAVTPRAPQPMATP